MFDISICIPTYNRASRLRQCLEHLATFADTSFELIVGDNASEDDTADVMADMAGAFPHCIYVRRSQNVGFARNMDSLLRRATRKYIYILNDDDLVFEGALKVAVSVMDGSPTVVAVVGQYLSLRAVQPELTMHYDDAVATVVPRGAQAVLVENLSLCDGHPILRRETFERHGAYLDRTGMLIPLYFTLLAHGDVVVVNKPFFQHLTSNDSLTSRMAEAWFIDMANADIELAISGCAALRSPDITARTREKLLQMIYFQGTRMAFNSGHPYLMWLSLRRFMAVGDVSQELLVHSEARFTHDFIIDRVVRILHDGEEEVVATLACPAVDAVVAAVRNTLPKVRFEPAAAPSSAPVLCKRREDAASLGPNARVLALDDLFAQIRLTGAAAVLAADEGRLGVRYADPVAEELLAQPSPSFDMLCAPYGQIS
ncbi:glycosyltransferase family 2 protein [Azospirillum sp.]|uniref:glycosyltransferase family 2 protein n=1 Tax=Azospirillum sp. TaxID=34012 RepID=UPI003D70ACA6